MLIYFFYNKLLYIIHNKLIYYVARKTNISARVEITLKQIVDESIFNHKDAYELGAKLIAIADAEKTIELRFINGKIDGNLFSDMCLFKK